jgi:Cft2 family RNA processing exonuclease
MNSITHLGGENTVTGSCHLLQANGLNILVDCGLAQGSDEVIPFAQWPVQPKQIDYLFLTHAHIDHIGRIPELVQKGFSGEIICSHPTKALLFPMLTDAMGFADLSKKEIHQLSKKIDELSWGFEYGHEFALKKGITFKLGRAGHILGSAFIKFTIPIRPDFVTPAKAGVQYPVSAGTPAPEPGTTSSLPRKWESSTPLQSSSPRRWGTRGASSTHQSLSSNTPHRQTEPRLSSNAASSLPRRRESSVPPQSSSPRRRGSRGSSIAHQSLSFNTPHLHTEPKQTPNTYTIIFSGDLGNKNTPILPDPDIPDPCDLLILESTYGNRLHENREDRLDRLNAALKRAIKDNGKIFIPAFSLGRTQEILFEFDRLFTRSEWQKKKIPVFVDSPLGLQITKIYSNLSSWWDKESSNLLNNDDHPFDFDHLYSVPSFKDHAELLKIPGPAIIIAGSGMCTGGRIIDHLISGLPEPKNDVFFVGYQAPGTPGHELSARSHQPTNVYLKGRKTQIKAKVEQLTGYSAHADQPGLIDWVQSMPSKPGKIKLVHGNPKAQKELRDNLIKLDLNIIEP